MKLHEFCDHFMNAGGTTMYPPHMIMTLYYTRNFKNFFDNSIWIFIVFPFEFLLSIILWTYYVTLSNFIILSVVVCLLLVPIVVLIIIISFIIFIVVVVAFILIVNIVSCCIPCYMYYKYRSDESCGFEKLIWKCSESSSYVDIESDDYHHTTCCDKLENFLVVLISTFLLLPLGISIKFGGRNYAKILFVMLLYILFIDSCIYCIYLLLTKVFVVYFATTFLLVIVYGLVPLMAIMLIIQIVSGTEDFNIFGICELVFESIAD